MGDLDRLIAQQDGIVSRAQALESGLSARQIDRLRQRGALLSVLPGVYRSAQHQWSTKGWIQVTIGARQYVPDLCFLRERIAIEVDGWAWHSSPERFRRDRDRQNQFILEGWLVLRFTWYDLTQRPIRCSARSSQPSPEDHLLWTFSYPRRGHGATEDDLPGAGSRIPSASSRPMALPLA